MALQNAANAKLPRVLSSAGTTPPSNPAAGHIFRELDPSGALVEDWIWDSTLGGSGRWKSQRIYSTNDPLYLYDWAAGVTVGLERSDIRGTQLLVEGFVIRGYAASTHTSTVNYSFQFSRSGPAASVNVGSAVNTSGFNASAVSVVKSTFAPVLSSDMFFSFAVTKNGAAGNLTALAFFQYRQIRG